MNETVCLIEDDPDVQLALKQSLGLEGYAVSAYSDAESALNDIDASFDGVVLTDIRLPGKSGKEVLKQLHDMDPDLPVIVMTGHGDIPLAVECIRLGAFEFLTKPLDTVQLHLSIRNAQKQRALFLSLQEAEGSHTDLADLKLWGASEAAARLRDDIRRVAKLPVDVVIHGETGTGKEVVAQLLHDMSPRASGPFVAVNCGALPEGLVDSELFGYVAGAFTGAVGSRVGRIEFSSGGTLFLDEVESMPLPTQVRLLRVLQERRLARLGSNKEIDLDLRVVAATKIDLQEAAKDGAFREDLYFRLHTASIDIPPLRHRDGDASFLFHRFLQSVARDHGLQEVAPQDDQIAYVAKHSWPGNIRELLRYSERVAMGIDETTSSVGSDDFSGKHAGLSDQVRAFERELLTASLQRNKGRLTGVMEELELPRKTLQEKMAKHGLSRSDFVEDN